MPPRSVLVAAFVAALVPAASAAPSTISALSLVNRLSWGETAQGDTLGGLSPAAWLEQQLHPSADDGLPPAVQARIAAMDISQKSLAQMNEQAQLLKQAAQAEKLQPGMPGDMVRELPAHRAWRDYLLMLEHQARERSLLRGLYSRNQLKEQLTWFWFNHFNVDSNKAEVRVFVGDYENTIRDHAFGKFRDLLVATATHPAMLQYLDNAQNAAGHINENYAREIMELHTMGVGSGYSQQDVQELARILTGLGLNLNGRMPGGMRRGDFRLDFAQENQPDNLALFNARRHDFGDKQFLGTTIKGRGIGEIAAAISILAAEPATAHFVSRQLAQYFCCDAPSDRLVKAMAATWKRTDGDISEILKTLFASPEFAASLGHKFKDPMHYVLSAVRASYGNQVVVNLQPIMGWLGSLGEPLYGHLTPDGYALTSASWAAPGAMAQRFVVAQQLGGGARILFKPEDGAQPPLPPPVLQQTAYYTAVTPTLSPATVSAISQGAAITDRNMLFLASPEFMRR